MNYSKIYEQLIVKSKNRASSKQEAKDLLGYFEGHHIVPRCLGGGNEEENIAYLTAEEHYVAHQLLVKMYPNEHKLYYACAMMCAADNESAIRPNNKLYGWIRKRLSIIQKSKNKFNDAGLMRSSIKQTGRTKADYEYLQVIGEKTSLALKGRTKETHEHVAQQAEKIRGRTKETHEYLKITAEKNSKTFSGRTKETHEYRKIAGEKNSKILSGRTKDDYEYLKNRSEKMKGRTKDTYAPLKVIGEKVSKTTKGRTKETHAHIAKHAETLRGRTMHTHPSLKAASEKLNILSQEQRDKIVDMRVNEKMMLKEIHKYLLDQNIKIAFSTVGGIINREIKLSNRKDSE
jgi:hypothetical protein